MSALDAVAALWRGVLFVRDQMSWEGAEEAWQEVTGQPALGPLLLAAEEAILCGRRVAAWSAEVEKDEVDALQKVRE